MALSNTPLRETWEVEKSHSLMLAVRINDRYYQDLIQPSVDECWLTVRATDYTSGDVTDSTALIHESATVVQDGLGENLFLFKVQASQLDLNPNQDYWYGVTYLREGFSIPLIAGEFVVSSNPVNRGAGETFSFSNSTWEYVATFDGVALLNVTATIPTARKGDTGNGLYVTSTALNEAMDGITTVTNSTIETLGRELQLGDLMVSSVTPVLAVVQTIGALTSTVKTVGKIVGPAGPEGPVGPEGPPSLSGPSVQSHNALQTGSDGRAFLDLGQLAPTGSVIDYAGSSAPRGWLLCDGSTYSPSAYPALFAVIGATYGGTEASPRLPDLRGRVTPMRDTRIPGFGNLGVTGGAASVTLGQAQMPAHSHGMTHSHGMSHTHPMPHTHSIDHSHLTATTGAAGAHTHTVSFKNRLDTYRSGGDLNAHHNSIGSNISFTTSSDGDHTHDVTIPAFTGSSGYPSNANTGAASSSETASYTGNTLSVGGSAPHENMPPYFILNKIIKAV